MQLVASFVGKNRDFRAWLVKQKCQVVDLAEYRKKKTARKRATVPINPSIA